MRTVFKFALASVLAAGSAGVWADDPPKDIAAASSLNPLAEGQSADASAPQAPADAPDAGASKVLFAVPPESGDTRTMPVIPGAIAPVPPVIPPESPVEDASASMPAVQQGKPVIPIAPVSSTQGGVVNDGETISTKPFPVQGPLRVTRTPAPAAPAPIVVAPPGMPPAGAVPVAKQVFQPQPTQRQSRARRSAVGTVKADVISQDEINQADILWRHSGQAGGVIGTNGAVSYAYGETRPVIFCAPLHLCVVQLINGEQITDLSIGDSVRWKVAASRAGDTPVVVLKPVASGLETNLTVLSDQGRVYYMTLKSTVTNYVPLVQFYNPQEIVEKINTRNGQIQAQAQAVQEGKDSALGKLDPATLDYNYTCVNTGKGDALFKPTRMFSGNGHIYLQMPDDMKYHDAPAAFDETNDSTQLINSRLVRGYTILDGLPDKFKLVVGVGKEAQTVTCAHGKVKIESSHSSWSGSESNIADYRGD